MKRAFEMGRLTGGGDYFLREIDAFKNSEEEDGEGGGD